MKTVLLLGALGAACVGPAPAVADAATSAPAAQGCPLQLVFEPALAEPGVLFVEHECGLRLHVTTGRAGADLVLPPGPASLRLVAGDGQWSVPVVVGAVRQVVVRTGPAAEKR